MDDKNCIIKQNERDILDLLCLSLLEKKEVKLKKY